MAHNTAVKVATGLSIRPLTVEDLALVADLRLDLPLELLALQRKTYWRPSLEGVAKSTSLRQTWSESQTRCGRD